MLGWLGLVLWGRGRGSKTRSTTTSGVGDDSAKGVVWAVAEGRRGTLNSASVGRAGDVRLGDGDSVVLKFHAELTDLSFVTTSSQRWSESEGLWKTKHTLVSSVPGPAPAGKPFVGSSPAPGSAQSLLAAVSPICHSHRIRIVSPGRKSRGVLWCSISPLLREVVSNSWRTWSSRSSTRLLLLGGNPR